MATTEEIGRHLKAAMVLADMTASQLAIEVGEDLQISQATIERVMQGRRTPRSWELDRFAVALGVPRSFLEHGPGPPAEEVQASDRDIPSILDNLPAKVADAVIESFRSPEFREALRAALAATARADTAGRRRQLEHDEPA